MSMWLLGGLVAALQAITFTHALEQSAHAPLLDAAVAVEATRREYADKVSLMTHNPVFGAQPGARALAHGGGSGFEIYLSLSQRINLAGLSKKRREALARELEHDAAGIRQVRMVVRRAVAEQWLARWAAQAALTVAERERALASELQTRLGTLVSAGEAMTIDQAAARTWAAEAQLAALALEDEALRAGVTLAQVMGRTAGEPQAVAEELPEIDLGDEDALYTRASDVRTAPDVLNVSTQRAADQSRLRETAAARGATMAFGVFGWKEGGGDVAAVGTLEVDIPVFERGERDRATAAAELERARGVEQDTVLRVQAERTMWLHDLQHTREVLHVVEKEMLPAAHTVADGQLKRMQAHEATTQEWVIARRAVLKSEIEAIRARAAHALARFLVHEAFAPGSAR